MPKHSSTKLWGERTDWPPPLVFISGFVFSYKWLFVGQTPGLLSLRDLAVKSSDAGLTNYWVRIQILCEVKENLIKKLLKKTGQIQDFVLRCLNQNRYIKIIINIVLMKVSFYKIIIYKELTCTLARGATPKWGVRCNDEMTISCIKVVVLFFLIYLFILMLYHQKLLVLKEGVCMGIVLPGKTLKDMLAHYSCVLNSALAGLAKNIVGAQITLK